MPIEAEYWAENLNSLKEEQRLKESFNLKSSKIIPTSYKNSNFSIFEDV
ncbi:MAG: hypothetical protein JXA54_09900 [Candidatus Heimdallarchaeota archaeon]|nr:hypothetical protein [Candidatus Heimdallarchaeota archaeon]